MNDKIDISKDRDSTCHHLLIASITKLSKKKKDEFMKLWNGSDDHEMCLLVDDNFKLSIKDTMEEWDKQVDNWVNKRAEELIEEKISGVFNEVTADIRDNLDEIQDKLKGMLKNLSMPNYKKSGMRDINGVEIIEGHIIQADGYPSDDDLDKVKYCVEFSDGTFGSCIYSDFEPLSRYKTIKVLGHCEDFRKEWENGELEGNIGSYLKD